jgi:hypothetical protein
MAVSGVREKASDYRFRDRWLPQRASVTSSGLSKRHLVRRSVAPTEPPPSLDAAGCATDERWGSGRIAGGASHLRGARRHIVMRHPPVGGRDWPSSLSRLRPIFAGSRNFDSETAICDSSAWSYDWRRVGDVLHRQWNAFRDCRSGHSPSDRPLAWRHAHPAWCAGSYGGPVGVRPTRAATRSAKARNGRSMLASKCLTVVGHSL